MTVAAPARWLPLVAASVVGWCATSVGLAAQPRSSLAFDAAKYGTREITVDDTVIAVRAFENVSYVSRPLDASVQVMNVYVPEAYYRGERIGGFTAETAPIFFPNQVGGFMPALPGGLDTRRPEQRVSTIAQALARGFVVASPGARGRTSQDAAGRYIGKAPAAIVDLKAAVRYLRSNDAAMPGDARRIIANGTSAGGALTSLLGASGNSKEFAAALEALGAADAPDDVFAVSAYCPITDLEHADAAYEWQLRDVHEYRGRGSTAPGMLTAEQLKISGELASQYPPYLNGLKLRDTSGKALTLDRNGKGSFHEYLKSFVIASAQRALDTGQDLSAHRWLRIEGGKVRHLDFSAYLDYLGRMKQPPAFDSFDLSSPETQLFGTETIDKRHFTAYARQHDRAGDAALADAATVRSFNPLAYIGARGVTTTQHWRIRHGTRDRDTSLAVPVVLATTLMMQKRDVDFALAWDKPHGGDYDTDELFAWMEKVSQTAAISKPSSSAPVASVSGDTGPNFHIVTRR